MIGQWIMIIKDIPTNPSPPRMGMFWATPWPMDEKYYRLYKQQARIWGQAEESWDLSDPENPKMKRAKYPEDCIVTPFGKDPNPKTCVKVHWQGEDIRVFQHEFSIPTVESMQLYVNDPNNPSHYLVPDNVAGEQLFKLLEDADFKNVYESALLDGCSENEAMLMGLGHDISDEPFPPVGWYKLRDEYAAYFGIDVEANHATG